jgi:hypothetical protein
MPKEPLAQFALLAFGLVANLCLFLSLKREMHSQAQKQSQALAALATSLRAVVERETPLETLPRPAGPAFNLNRRAQAARLLRQGEDVAHVAAALGVPRQEVELFIRVQAMAVKAAAASPKIVTQSQ